MKKRVLFIAIVGLIVSNCMCAQISITKNNNSLMKLEIGMTKAQVLEIMGNPDLNEAYKYEGKTALVYFYYTQRIIEDGVVTKNECTPLVLVEGKLIGWGSEFYR